MNDPIYILFRHALDDDIYLEYMEDPREYRKKGCILHNFCRNIFLTTR